MTTQEIKDRIAVIDEIIAPLQREHNALNDMLLAERSEFKVGDIIEWGYGGGKVATGRVKEIRHWVCGEPYWVVERIKMDGSPGQSCKVYSYQKPKKNDNHPKTPL